MTRTATRIVLASLSLVALACSGGKDKRVSGQGGVEKTTHRLSPNSRPFIRYDILTSLLGPNPAAVDAYLTQSGNQLWTLEAQFGAPTAQVAGTQGTLAWEVNSLSTAGREERWTVPVTAHDVVLGRARGWTLRNRVRLPTANDAPGYGVSSSYLDGMRVWVLQHGTDAAGDALVRVLGDSRTVTVPGGAIFHDYELTYDPAVGTAFLRIDGQIALTDIVGDSPSTVSPLIMFGDLAQVDDGHGQYQAVEWRIHDDEFPSSPPPLIPRGTARVRYEITSDAATHDPAAVDAHLIDAGQQPWQRQMIGGPAALALVDGEQVALDINTYVGGPGREDRYFLPLSALDVTAAQDRGWAMKVRARVIRANDSVGWGVAAQYYTGERIWELLLGSDSAGRPIVRTTGDPRTVTVSQGGFHTYELVYDPATARATLFVDNVAQLTDLPGEAHNFTPGRHIMWGDLAQVDDGHGQFQLFEWSIPDASTDSNLVTIIPGEHPTRKYTGQLCVGAPGTPCLNNGNGREFVLPDGTYWLSTPFNWDLPVTTDRLGTITISGAGTQVALDAQAQLHFHPPVVTGTRRTTLTARTFPVRLDKAGYPGYLRLYASGTFVDGEAYLIASRTYALLTDFAAPLPNEDWRLWFSVQADGHVSVDREASRRTIRAGENAAASTLIAQVAPVTLVRNGWLGWLALYATGIDFPSNEAQSTGLALRGRRYSFYTPYSSVVTHGNSTYMASNGIDLTVEDDGRLVLNPELDGVNFIVTPANALQALPVPITLEKAGYAGSIQMIDGPVLAETNTVQTLRGFRHSLLLHFTAPLDAAVGDAYAYFNVNMDGSVSPHGPAAEDTFVATGPNPSVPTTLRARTTTLYYEPNGFTGSLHLYGAAPLRSEGAVVLRGRRYQAYADYSIDVTREDHFFSPTFDVTISRDGYVSVSGGAAVSFSLTSHPTTLSARVGTMIVQRGGYTGPLSIYGHIGTSAPGPLTTPLLLGHRYTILPGDGRVTFAGNGTCSPPSMAVTGGTLTFECSPTVVPPTPPTQLTAVITSATQVDLRWLDNTPYETGYAVERRSNTTDPWQPVPGCALGASQVACNDTTGLVQGTEYQYRVRVNSAAGSAYSAPAIILFDRPAAPTALVGDATAPAEVTVRWTDNSLTEQGFRIERSEDGVTFTEVGTTGANVAVFADGSVISGTSYHYRARSYNAIGASLPTNVQVIVAGPPGPPSNVQAQLVDWLTNVGVVHVTWNDNSTNETGFTVERSSDGGASFQPVGETGRDAGGPNGGFADWVGQGTHIYRIRASSAVGVSTNADSPPVSIGPVATPALTGTVISATRVDLSWTALTNATSATIFRSVDGGAFASLATLTLPASAYSDMSTTENHAYAYRLDVSNLLGGQSSNVVNASTTAPAAPGLPWAVPASTSTVTIHWAYTPANETGFRVQRSTDGGSSYQTIQSVGRDVRSYTDGGHWEWRTILYRIVAHHHLDGPPSPALTVFMQAPSGPSAATAEALSTSSIRVRWTDNSRTESGFVVTRRTNGGAPVDLVTTALDAQEYVDNTVALGARYTYEVWSANLFGRSWHSAVAPDVIFQTPNAATALTATIASPGQVNLSWTGGSTDATELRLERTAVGASNPTAWTLALGATSFSDTTALVGGTYDYRVVSSNALGSNATQAVQVAMLPPAVAPTSLTGVLTSWGTRMDLSWAFTGSQHTRFRLERAVGTGDYAFLANPLASDRAYNDMSVPAGTNLRYRIMAENVIGLGPASNVLEVSLLPASPPSGLLAKVFSGTRIDVTWTDTANNESGYHVQWSTIGGSWENWSVTPELPANTQSYSLTGLSPDTNYHVRVFAASSVGASAPSNTDITRTAVVGSTAPAGLTAASQGPAVVGLAWTWGGAVPNENGFEVQRSPLEGTPVWAAIGNADRHQRTYVDRTVQAGVGYQYRVRAFNGISPPSEFSSIASATTPASCTGQADNTECNDGNACTTVDRCQGGVCVGGSPRTCQAGTACSTFTCDPADGVCKATNRPLGTPCDDSSLCTTGDVCNGAGACGGAPKVCSDGNACTTDTCVASTGTCQNTASICAVTPTVCTLTDADLGQVAVFGYSSSVTANVEMAYGADNQLTPTTLQGRQPRWFESGTKPAAFTLPLNGGSVSWRLGQTTVTAPSGAGACSAATRTAAREALQVDVAQSIPALVPPTAVGTLSGEVGVTHKGTAVYSIPLDLPMGRNGIQPAISLVYNSGNNSMGHLGVGWSLQGLSLIHRCSRDSARDGDPAPIQFDIGDHFCLDGERLVQVSSPAEPLRYKTERDSYSRITGGDFRYDAPESFTVQTTDGRTLTYGFPSGGDTPALVAHIPPNPTSLNPEEPEYGQTGDGPSLNTRLFNWPLTEVRDRFGNYMTIAYTTSGGSAENGFAFERRIREITYTHRAGLPGRRAVRFEYWSPTAMAAKLPNDPNPFTAYAGGVKATVSRFLQAIEIVAPNPVTPVALRRYNLDYSESPATRRPRLSYVQECDMASGVCKPRTNFTYSDGSTNFRRIPTSITGEQLSARTLANYQQYQFDMSAGISAGDVNGDGRDDIVYKPASDTLERKLHLSTGEGFGDATTTTISTGGFGVPFLFDITGDGRSELGTFHAIDPGPSVGQTFHTLNVPTPAPANLESHALSGYDVVIHGDSSLEFADVNGDGFAEPITITDDDFYGDTFLGWGNNIRGVVAPLQQFSPESAASIWPETLISFDIDGDGANEVLFLTDSNRKLSYRKRFADGSVFFGQTNIPSQGGNIPPFGDTYRHVGRTWHLDVNGDGLLDIAYLRHRRTSSSAEVHEMVRQINTGAGFLPPVVLMNAGGTNIINPLFPANSDAHGHTRDDGVRILDWDGDGADDILMMDDGGSYDDGINDGTGNRLGVAARPTMRVLRFNRQGLLSTTKPDTGIAPGAHANGPSGVEYGGCDVEYSCTAGSPPRCTIRLNGAPAGTIPSSCLTDTRYPRRPFGFNTSITLDANGDGLTDFLQYEPSANAVVLYLREGGKPDLLTNVTDGLGSFIEIGHKALTDNTQPGPIPQNAAIRTFYENNPNCPSDFHCAKGGLWAVSSVTRDVGAAGLTTYYTYADGRFSREQQGFLGFRERWEHTRNLQNGDIVVGDTRVAYKSFDPLMRGSLYQRIYPYLGVPSQVDTTIGPRGASDTFSRRYHRTLEEHRTEARAAADGTYEWFNNGSTVTTWFRPSVLAAQVQLSVVHANNYYHTLGRLSEVTVNTYDHGQWIETKQAVVRSWHPDNLDESWVIGPPRRIQSTDTVAPGPTGQNIGTQTVEYDYHPTTQFLRQIIREPDGDPSLRLTTTYADDGTGLPNSIAATGMNGGVMQTRQLSITYDPVEHLYPRTTTNNRGFTRTTVYQPAVDGLAVSRDHNGVVQKVVYDHFGRLRRKDNPDAPLRVGDVFIDYEPGSLAPGVAQTRTRVEGGTTTIVQYDRQGKVVRSESALAAGDLLVDTFYDVLGRVHSVTRPYLRGTTTPQDANLARTTFTYDELGRPTIVTGPGADGQDVTLRRFAYNGLNTTIFERKSATAETKRAFEVDARGLVKRAIDELVDEQGIRNVAAEYHYAPFGLLESVAIRPASGTTAMNTMFRYDVAGRLWQVNDSERGIRSATFNAFDEVMTSADPGGATTTNVWDDLGRRISRTASEGQSIFTYDSAENGLGALHRATSPDGVVNTLGYDVLGRTRSAITAVGGQNLEFQYTYDPVFGRPDGIVYPETPGWTRLRTQNVYHQVTGELMAVNRVDAPQPIWQAEEFDQEGRVIRDILGSWLRNFRTYNPRTGLLEMSDSDNPTNGQPIERLSYGYEDNGNLRHRLDLQNGVFDRFEYDSLNRLRTWQEATSAGLPMPNGWQVGYRYDDVGNMLDRTATARNPVTQLVATQTAVYGHGGGDNTTDNTMTSWHIAGGDLPTAAGVFEYDQNRRISRHPRLGTIQYNSFDLPETIAGVVNASFGYDATGTRAYKYESSTLGESVTLYAGGLYEMRILPANALEHVLHLEVGGASVGNVTRVRTAVGQLSEATKFYTKDILGSIRGVVADDGSVQRKRTDPFGNDLRNPAYPVLDTAPLVMSTLGGRTTGGFTGHEHDEQLGLINMRGRMFDPMAARFLSPDPGVSGIFDTQAWNSQSYVGNRPTAFVDPSGYFAMPAYRKKDAPHQVILYGFAAALQGCVDSPRGCSPYSFGLEVVSTEAGRTEGGSTASENIAANLEGAVANAPGTDKPWVLAQGDIYPPPGQTDVVVSTYTPPKDLVLKGTPAPFAAPVDAPSDPENGGGFFSRFKDAFIKAQLSDAAKERMARDLAMEKISEALEKIDDLERRFQSGQPAVDGGKRYLVLMTKGVRQRIANTLRAVANGVLHGHHGIPKFLGGHRRQLLTPLKESIHKEFHSELSAALKAAGIPLNVGGRGGSAADWARHFTANPGSQTKALGAVLDVSMKIDAKHGTAVTLDVLMNISRGNYTPYP